jgi:hypothetical protein
MQVVFKILYFLCGLFLLLSLFVIVMSIFGLIWSSPEYPPLLFLKWIGTGTITACISVFAGNTIDGDYIDY